MKIKSKDFTSIPNLISLFRISMLVPLSILLSDLEANRQLIIGIIVIALISDLLDGFIARKMNSITELGKILDPLGDKLFIIVLVTSLYFYSEIDHIYFLSIILRDIIILIGGIIVSKMIGKVLPSNLLGKISALSIAGYIFIVIVGLKLTQIGIFVYYFSLILSYVSIIGYAYRGIESVIWYRKNEIS
jgi:cardiolipin synthase